MLTQEQQAKLKQHLLEEKKRLEKKLTDNHHFGLETGMNDSIGELSGYDNHPADVGTELYERGKDIALNEESEVQLEEVEMALLRMEEGHYGICAVCGMEIPYERLEAVPETAYCIEHQRERDISNRRPAEEDVTRPPFGRDFLEGKEHKRVSWDGEDAWQDVERYGTSNPPDFQRDGENYNELGVEPDERRGYVDDVEAVALADLDGRPTEQTAAINRGEASRRLEEDEEEKRAPERD
ncbi:TraR/DksA C4-type zinc finger protein [Desmospora activa]|uniref:TraR/DksA family transcriptional regulator n=1 Tax=Desmospora activa DSM 45169 TaxID=1121389 RepID=A0A2T4ZBD2_9BACL|nr:TraR/DksA C4-type zinc finger protein [Desmospora activa]PTM59200.1 TraR/DksA family transcriptional regulator [Desmospora activa DSM 45169]